MNGIKKWKNFAYLKEGNPKQRLCYEVITEIRLFERLACFEPLPAGTIPIGIDIPGSDLDVVCKAENLSGLQETVRAHFAGYLHFTDKLDETVYVAGFEHRGLPVEIYAEFCDSAQQNGFRHMLIEDKILKLAGKKIREQVIKLKLAGLKTEPAFGKLLGLEEPYGDLLRLEKLPDRELRKFIRERLRSDSLGNETA